ncbi:MAG: response regulator transcription factor [Chitinophagaceae bacterium]
MTTVIHLSSFSLFRKGVRQYVGSRDGVRIIGEAENGAQLLALLEHQLPDVLLMDILLPGMPVSEIFSEVTSRYPDIKILILSVHNAPSVIVSMLEMGAKGYLTIDSEAEEIHQLILASSRPGILFSKDAKRSLIPGEK